MMKLIGGPYDGTEVRLPDPGEVLLVRKLRASAWAFTMDPDGENGSIGEFAFKCGTSPVKGKYLYRKAKDDGQFWFDGKAQRIKGKGKKK